MKTIELITYNCFIFLTLLIVSTDSQLFSVLALATLAKVLRPRPKYRPPIYYDPMAQSSSHGSPIMMRPPIIAQSAPQLVQQPMSQPIVQSIQQPFAQSVPLAPSKRGFGYPVNQQISANEADVWPQNQQNSNNQNIPNFSSSQPSNGLQLANLGSSLSSNNLILSAKPQVFPVFKFVPVNSQQNNRVKKG